MRLPRFVSLGAAMLSAAAPVGAMANQLVRVALPPALARADDAVSLELGARPLPEALARLSRQTSLVLVAGPGLEDQKVTLLFRHMPLADAARALAAATDGVWRERRSKAAGGAEMIRYRLEPSERRLAQLQWSRATWHAAEAWRDQAALDFLVNHLTGRTVRPDPRDPDAPRSISLHQYPEPLFPMIRTLPRGAIEQLVSNANETPRTYGGPLPGAAPALVVPGAILPEAQQQQLTGFMTKLADELGRVESPSTLKAADACRTLAQHPQDMQLHFWAIRRTYPDGRLQVEMYLRLISPQSGWATDLSLGDSPYTRRSAAPTDPKDLAPRGARLQDASLEANRLDLTYGSARADRGLIELARAAGVNLAADYYTKPTNLPLFANGRPLADLLAEAERNCNLFHFWEGPTLVLRSRDWQLAYDCEPPAAVTDAWDRRGGLLTFENYLQAAAAMDDARIANLINHADERGRHTYQYQTRRLFLYRHVLRGYAALSDAQRKQASARDGTPIAGLSRSQAERWRPALDRYALYPAEWLQKARLVVVPSESRAEPMPRFFLFGPPGLPSIELVTDEPSH